MNYIGEIFCGFLRHLIDSDPPDEPKLFDGSTNDF